MPLLISFTEVPVAVPGSDTLIVVLLVAGALLTLGILGFFIYVFSRKSK